MIRKIVSSLSLLTIFIAACGPRMAPGAAGSRESGQSKLMDDTFAGKNACNPENHERPFIIEWDATDMSQFESITSSDVVLVKYEGCKLTVLDGCKDDSVKGSYGAYKPVEWTSGSLEKMEIKSEAELYANLPLGVASLGGRVSGGEQFRMEYYVAGTRSATRPAVYAADLKSNPGCAGATHFVYGYNLGAFALGSKSKTSAEIEGSVYGFGAGAKNKQEQSADKKGGDLGICKSDSATEIEGCKVPIRLTLRKIEKGENPDVAARQAPETDAAKNLAAKVDAKIEVAGKAGEHWASANTKMNARDGKGCLTELDKHDKLDPKHKSTDPKSGRGYTRARCLMLAGKCDAGKLLNRKTAESYAGSQLSPEQIDKGAEAEASRWCQGKMSDRDTFLKAFQEIQQGAYMAKKTPKFCDDAYKTAKQLMKTVKPKDDDDTQVANAPKALYHMGANCAARAGDCKLAWKIFVDGYPIASLASAKDQATKDTIMQSNFDSLVSKCKKK
ncbi:MAG TPA: hypothetical protein PKA88_05075 [Polyangiaceae bacterium]|nr:hypothetical protein [Polyangiaceae bacterium]HMR73487.1 hypothetical protein [Polyangiaceae bacterium]